MKLFVTSDIHSHWEPFKKALDDKGFKPNSSDQLLLVLGDCFDRGPDSYEVYKFLNSLDNVVLIRGNHEDLLEDVWRRGGCLSHDKSNGTQKTVNNIFYSHPNLEPYDPIKVSEKVLKPFFDKFVNYWESTNYIFCHSWIPCKVSYVGLGESKPWYMHNKTYEYMSDWREANEFEWQEARWGNPFKMAEAGLNQTSKTIVFGHFHSSWPRANYEGKPEFGDGADFSPYYGNNYIGLDACTAASNTCNVIVLEDEPCEVRGSSTE